MSEKLSYVIIIITIVAFLLCCVDIFFGSYEDWDFFSCERAERAANKYLLKHHAGSDYEISSSWYDDKDGRYYVSIKSPSSQDSHFRLGYDRKGKLTYNSYESGVANKENTAVRLSKEYAAAVKEALDTIPNSTDFACVVRLLWSNSGSSRSDPCYISPEELRLDGVYDLSELGAQSGDIWFRIEADSEKQVTAENLAQILLYVRKTLDEADLPFYRISCRLSCWSGGDRKVLSLAPFLYDDIYEEGLEARLRQALES